MTGFRLAFGGAQERYGILPDLTTFGKIIGGGLPVGAYGGPADIMNMVAPLGPVYQAGTLSGNPLAMAAGLATLRYLRSHKSTVYTGLEMLSCTVDRRSYRGRQGRRRAALLQPRRVDVHLVLYRRPGHQLDLSRQVRHQSLCPLLSRHAGQRRVPAAIAVRGRIPERRPHRKRHPSDHRGRETGIRKGDALTEI